MLPSLRRLPLLLPALALLFSVACAMSPPVQEMSNARQTIQAAIAAGAEQAAPELLARARSALQQASEALDQDEYEVARNHANEAKQYAIEARKVAMRKSRPAK